MSTEKLVPVTVRNLPDAPHLAWAQNGRFMLPASLLEKGGAAAAILDEGDSVCSGEFPPPTPEQAGKLSLRAAFTERQPLSSRLPFSYRKIPARIRSLIATVTGRLQRRREDRWAAFPKWPLDLSADFLADLFSSGPSAFASGPTPVLLSHDLDSAEGLRNLVKYFLDLEETFGARSANYIVPCSWSIDHELLTEVKERGHEVGIHGYDHGNLTPFAEVEERRRRLQAAQPLVERYEIDGYRSPSLLRTRNLLRDLSKLYRYDSSIPTSGGLFPVPNNGCASARPFFVEGIWEIPLSLPRDGSMRFLGYSPGQIADLWIECADQIARSGGVVVLLTHCEARFSGNSRMLDAYRHFLEHVSASDRYVWSTPAEVLSKIDGIENIN